MKTKNFFYALSVAICLLGVSTNAWAGSDYYASLEAYVANSSGVGKVYVGTSEDSSSADMESGYMKSTSEANKTTKIKAWAYPSSGYELYRWEFVSAVRNTKSSTANHTAADITSASSPFEVELNCPSGSKDKPESTSELTIRAIFWRPNGVNVDKLTFRTTEHGKYSVRSIAKDGVDQTTYDYTDIRDTEKEVSDVITGMPIDCRATADDGYIFYSYYTLDKYGNKAYVGDLLVPNQVILIEDDVVELGAEFTDNAFRIGDTFVKTLSDALQFVRTSSNKVIQVIKDYEVPAGYYTIPAGVTLLIPRDARQTMPDEEIERTFNRSYKTPSQHRILTLLNGVHIDVFGAVEAGCRQSAQGQSDAANGAPTGTYGHLYLTSGSEVVVESGATLRAWGFVTGDGTIDVRRGGEVHEQFQILDFKGGTNTSNMCGGLNAMLDGTSSNEGDVFPLNQYFIQNVEVKATYHPGAKLFCSTAWYMSMDLAADDIQLVGVRNHKDGSADDVAMFLMDDEDDSDDSWICKYYDRTKDRQMYEVNNSASIGSFVITMEGRIFPTANFDMPITSNMTIRLLNGNMDMTQDAVLLAGAEIILDKQSTFIVPEGVKLYLYDQAEWDKFVFSGFYSQRVKYVPHLNGAPTARINELKSGKPTGSTTMKPASAAIKVGGTMQIDGAIYTTKGGANITSTNSEAGTILFPNGAPSDSSQVCQWNSDYVYAKTSSAILRNADTTHPITATAGTPAGQSYCYMNGKWTMMTVDPDSSCFVYDQDGIYYAKPDGYVAINATKNMSTKLISGNADHTFSDASGNGKLYILVDGCQWWEVVNEDNLYHCQHPQNDTYYWWNDARMVDGQLNPGWEEKTYAISWVDYDGTPLKNSSDEPIVYHLPYGAQPKFLSTSPTRAADIDYYYDFKGWSPEITDSTTVTGDQTYTAVYEKISVKYEIVFKYEEGIKQGSVIKREFLPRDSMPTPPTLNPIEGYESYKWTPAIAAVKGNQTYEAKWIEKAPAKYLIRFVDFNGTTELKKDSVLANTLPTPPADPSGKISTNEYSYNFERWQPKVVEATADATYIAVYTETPRTYDVKFFKEDGTTQIGGTQALTFGANPVVPAYSKENPEAGRTYSLKWINMSTSASVGVNVPSVSGAVDYKAGFDVTVNRHTITLNCTNEVETAVVGCNFTGAGTYDYGTKQTLTATAKEGFQFLRWSDGITSASRVITVTENATFTAIVKELPSIILKVGETQTVSDSTKVYEFVIRSNGENSSNLTGSDNISIAEGGHAYFDLLLYAQRRHWKAFTVPFEVDLKQHPLLADGVEMPLGVQYDIIWYDGAVRAAQGKVADCWKYIEDQNDWILTPGVAYLIVFNRDVNTVRFTKKDGPSVAYSGTVSVAENNGATDEVNGGWNGIGNPATYHALLDAGVTECQVHNGEEIGSDGYITCDMGKFIVGKAVFVQVAATKSVVEVKPAEASDPTIAPKAPRHAKANAAGKNRFDVQIAPVNGTMEDRMFLLADEDKEDKYVILQDLAKAGLSTKRAQMWVERYNNKLSKNTALLVDGTAEYPLGIYAPQAGEYQISIAEFPNEETTLYLTLDGEIIWNLSYAPFIAELEKGTTLSYGLISVRSNAPGSTTAVENTQAGTQPNAQKILLDNKIYILRNGKLYSPTGAYVK